MLYADDAGIATHTKEDFQFLMNRLSIACNKFGLIISLSETKILSQRFFMKPSIN